MEDIVINGVSINGLKAQREAIKQGAAQSISDGIENVKVIVNKIVESDEENPIDVDALAVEAFDILDRVDLVSSVSGVEYYLPYNEPYGYNDDDTLTTQLEEWSDESDVNIYKGKIGRLYDQLGGMETQSRLWNSSSVHC